jgi:hypothetical protein
MSALAVVSPLVLVLMASMPRAQAPVDRSAASPVDAREPAGENRGDRELVAPRDPFARGTLGLELGGMLVTEAWNLNGPREWLAAGTAAVSWSFVNRTALLVEFEAVRVFQRTPRAAHVQGMATVIRRQVRARDPWRVFVELGPGISWSDTTVPPRGTRFNYLILAGGGLLRRVSSQAHLVTGARWWHLSNNSREGRSRNPDIEGIGGYAGLAIAF